MYKELVKQYLRDDEMVKMLLHNKTEVARYIIRKEGLSKNPESFRKHVKEAMKEMDYEIISKNVELKKSHQKALDTNRIERKAFREYARIENAVSEYSKELTSVIRENAEALKMIDIPDIIDDGEKVGVVQLSDWHANELIDLPHNKYDFKVLAKRAQKFANEAIKTFEANGITKVLIASVGDVINSPRRLDEILNQASNRSKATMLTVHILKQFIIHLRMHFDVTVVSVLGNESRVDKEMSFSNAAASDNYDYTIFAILKEMFEFANIPGVSFGSIDKMEEVVQVAGQNWLLTHDVAKASNKQKDTQSIIGRYYLSGNPIDFVLAGHIHDTRITGLSARGGSIAGSNTYNEVALNLSGRAEQNIFVVDEKSRMKIVVDLQNTDGIEGYDIIERLEAYNAKSADKVNKGTVEFRVVI